MLNLSEDDLRTGRQGRLLESSVLIPLQGKGPHTCMEQGLSSWDASCHRKRGTGAVGPQGTCTFQEVNDALPDNLCAPLLGVGGREGGRT